MKIKRIKELTHLLDYIDDAKADAMNDAKVKRNETHRRYAVKLTKSFEFLRLFLNGWSVEEIAKRDGTIARTTVNYQINSAAARLERYVKLKNKVTPEVDSIKGDNNNFFLSVE